MKDKKAQAVALRYVPARHEAPVVVAKGRGRVAEALIAKAREHGVPIHEDPSLVELLIRLDVDQAIPPELYALVAEVLAFVYRADQEAARRKWNV
ncbi:MAG: hypothetical protein BLM47_03240 [Candidatus Reconcilbacillus cellulovorans]|uniref:FhlB domain-containing protein n=1 Tax=Candidatus Reconcilbacillus cellulovorans TaxID=1906605 RepID=A0A2A6E2F9_9BACL|nr:MAG: hypothetical protein BLM47_03240 [Candidatus Reconcilbacillus cellulovorans]